MDETDKKEEANMLESNSEVNRGASSVLCNNLLVGLEVTSAVSNNRDTDQDNLTDSEEEYSSIVRPKKRVQRFSESDDDSEGEKQGNPPSSQDIPGPRVSSPKESDSSIRNGDDREDISDMNITTQKSRFRKIMSDCDSSDSDNAKRVDHELQPETSTYGSVIQEESRIGNKHDKLRNKFKSLLTKRAKQIKGSESGPANEEIDSDASHNSDNDNSIEKIRQIIKEKTILITNSICDPDTSDEEGSLARERPKSKKERRSTKLIAPKPIRMSAKQAMENMQKIKSESNRMLREKEVSLPYHRPKALTLKDILSKRRPAVSSDGKALPIKMNEQQLRQYVQQLEQRQKEVIELCKSESEGESEEESEEPKQSENNETIEDQTEIEGLNDTLYDDMSKAGISVDTNVETIPEATETNSDEPTRTNNSTDAEKIDVNDASSNTECLHAGDKPDITEPIPLEADNCTPSVTSEVLPDDDKNNSTDMEIIYNVSVEATAADTKLPAYEPVEAENSNTDNDVNKTTEADSQLIPLQNENTEKTDSDSDNVIQVDSNEQNNDQEPREDLQKKSDHNSEDFSDDEFCMDYIDALIENAEITASQNMANNVDSPMLIKEPDLSARPKLIGAPGMVIDLDGMDPLVSRKMTGVQLLKERFVFFSKLKTPEELEREREKTVKPGAQHLKLKLELEEQIAEQRSLEWAKRLEEEKKHLKDDDVKELGSDAEEIDQIEAKLEEKEQNLENEESSGSESEEEEIEQEIIDKPRKRNPMVDDEAEESDCDEIQEVQQAEENEDECQENEGDRDSDDNDEDDNDESSEESEEEQDSKLKKGRILKAFEDSDYECSETVNREILDTEKIDSNINQEAQGDDILQLAQKSISDDLFTSQESKTTKSSNMDHENNQNGSFEDKDLGTQTFSILEKTNIENVDLNLSISDKLSVPCDTQPDHDNLDAVVGMCSGSFSQTQNLITPSQTTDDVPESQAIGDNVLALCTGQFYDNQFVSQDDIENSDDLHTDKAETLLFDIYGSFQAGHKKSENKEKVVSNNYDKPNPIKELNEVENMNRNSEEPNKVETLGFDTDVSLKEGHTNNESREMAISDNDNKSNANDLSNEVKNTEKKVEDSNLKSILDELNDPEFDAPKSNKYFANDADGKENISSVANAQFKKKFVIDSDDDETEVVNSKKKKIKKKRKMEHRALQISDDEEDDVIEDEEDESEPDMGEEDEGHVVDYDSDENEVVVQAENPKKKRKLAEFFENEAELTSEDEWAGSGDEDEAGLDRMEREAGDDDTFNQRQLQRELGQIHMRDVLDQDKREVRLIQELLFEDGDLGSGSRQRKFRWKDVDGEEEEGSGAAEEMADTQEEEAESEEAWRKQRHEREVFLRALKNQGELDESFNINVTRTAILKANLSNNSTLRAEGNTSVENTDNPVPAKTAKDIPSPKKPFAIFQQNYHNSLLTRGRGALARLAALATPLAADDDDTPKGGSLAPTNKRNFVFAAVDTTKEDQPKITKRKAEGNIGTPRLVKKLRTEENKKNAKKSLLDHLKI